MPVKPKKLTCYLPALTKENLIQYYIGTVARQIMRKANCSVMLLTQPVDEARGFKNIVVDAEESTCHGQSSQMAIKPPDQAGIRGCMVRELNLCVAWLCQHPINVPEDEYKAIRRGWCRKKLKKVNVKTYRMKGYTNIKVAAGKSGYELAQFARRKKADFYSWWVHPQRFLCWIGCLPDLNTFFADLPLQFVNCSTKKGITWVS